MKRATRRVLATTMIASSVFVVYQHCVSPGAYRIEAADADDETANSRDPGEIDENLPRDVIEAQGRARLLHETIHGALQVMHRDFFREDESFSIPSHSLEDVFKELASSYDVQVRWLVVNAKAMNINNEPKDEFERNAAQAISSGKERFEAVESDAYRYAGMVRLSSQCLKCHLPARISNHERAAGLVITMPLNKSTE